MQLLSGEKAIAKGGLIQFGNEMRVNQLLFKILNMPMLEPFTSPMVNYWLSWAKITAATTPSSLACTYCNREQRTTITTFD